MTAAARQAVEEAGGESLLPVEVTDAAGVGLGARRPGADARAGARSSTSGSRKLIEEDGSRHFIWGGRPRSEGMPAFPIGRTAPAFPRVGRRLVGARVGARPGDHDAELVRPVGGPRPAGDARRGRHPGAAAPQAARCARRAHRHQQQGERRGLRRPAGVRRRRDDPHARPRRRQAPAGLPGLPGARARLRHGRRPARRRSLPGDPVRRPPDAVAGRARQLLPPLLRLATRSSASSPASTPACSTTSSGSSTRTGSRAAQDRPQRPQRARRHADPRDGHRHR